MVMPPKLSGSSRNVSLPVCRMLVQRGEQYWRSVGLKRWARKHTNKVRLVAQTHTDIQLAAHQALVKNNSLVAGYLFSILLRKNNKFRVIGEIDQTVNLLASTTMQITNTNIPAIILPGVMKQLERYFIVGSSNVQRSALTFSKVFFLSLTILPIATEIYKFPLEVHA